MCDCVVGCTCVCGSCPVPVPASHGILLLNVDSWGGGWDGGTPAYSSTKRFVTDGAHSEWELSNMNPHRQKK